MFGSIDRKRLRNELGIPDQYEIMVAIALGKPKEKVVLEEVTDPDDIKYWRDELGVHHVPKRTLKDIIVDL